MSRQMLTIMIAAIDIWAVLYALERYRRDQQAAWDVSVVISNPDAPPRMTLAKPEQVWLTPAGMGIWPDTQTPLSLEQVQAHLAGRAAAGDRVEVRLLCEPSLSLRQWGRVALALSSEAEEIRIAPLPSPGT